MNIGVFLAKYSRKSSTGRKQKNQTKPEKIYVLTENLVLLKKLSETLDMPIKTISKSLFSEGPLYNTMFIFDVDYMSYSQIFMIMKKFKNGNNCFRIRPSGCDFMIGSDQSDQKGSVVVF